MSRHPCKNCPWRLDADPNKIPGLDIGQASDLAAACPGPDSSLTQPLMACHESSEGDDRVCVGWAVSDASRHSVPLRLATMYEVVPPWSDLEAARLAAGIELHQTHADMIAALEDRLRAEPDVA